MRNTSAREETIITQILDLLRTMRWPQKNPQRDRTRSKVLQTANATIAAFALGKVRRYDLPGKLVQSQYNAKHPELYTLLKQLMQEHDPTFKYNAIQLNKNVKTKPHFDNNNLGPSYCLGIGTYRGGGLTLFPPDGPAYTLENRHKWVLYDGARLRHGSASVQSGTRFAVVYYQSTPTRRSPKPS